MAGSIAIVATLTRAASLEALGQIPAAVTILEVPERQDHSFSATELRRHYSGKLLYSLPQNSTDQFPIPVAARQRALIQAARDYDLVRLNADCDLSPEVLAAIPVTQRLISWRGESLGLAHLYSAFAQISSVPARYYSLITHGKRAHDGIAPLLLLKELRRTDVIAFCEGKAGFWSRILSPHFGAPLVFARLGHGPAGDSCEPSVHELLDDYGLSVLRPVHELYGIVGNRVFESLSPHLHNAGYRALDYPAVFLPFYVDCFEDFWREIIAPSAIAALGLSIKGLTIVSPHKEVAFTTASVRSPMASRAAASNIFLHRNGFWEAHTTDTESVVGIGCNGKKFAKPVKAAVIGCGGAGRAIAAALQQAGAQVTLVNRGKERAKLAVSLLGLPFIPLPEFRADGFSLVVNATPVGRDEDTLPFEIDSLASRALVVDLVYRAGPTPLVAGVVARGGTVIDGYDVLLNQVRKQFQLMTGYKMPSEIGRHTITARAFGSHLGARNSWQPHSMDFSSVCKDDA